MKTGFSVRGAFRIVLPVCALVLLALACEWPGVLARTPGQSQSGAQPAATQQAAVPAGNPQARGPQSLEGKTAGEAFKNIQVLKDIPADQLIPSMQYISAALGVNCEFCHVAGDRSKDDKRSKQTARKMITMLFAINKDNFNGRTQVTCYTCHRSASRPESVPPLPELVSATPGEMPAAANTGAPNAANSQPQGEGGAAAPSGPSATDILQKYVQALGGQDAISKISTLSEQGTVEAPARGPQQPQPSTVEVLRKAPDKVLSTQHRGNGASSEGFDGSAAWQQRGPRVADETGDALSRAKLWAQFIPGLDLANNPRARAAGTEKINGHDAYRVVAFQSGGPVTYYFDAQTGLLLRVGTRTTTPLGSLPSATDYDDYRDVSGLKVPFTVRMVRMEGATTYKWDQVQANVPVDDSRFAKPAASAPAQ